MMNYRRCSVTGRCIFVMCFAVALCGCAERYKTPERPRAELAVVTTESRETSVLGVDGLSTYTRLTDMGREEVLLTPAAHVLKVRRKKNGMIAEGQIEVDVEAGRRYILRTRSQGYRVLFWLEAEPAPDPPVLGSAWPGDRHVL